MTAKEWLKAACRKVGYDGLLHCVCSILLVVVFSIFLPVWAAAIVSLVTGVTKEICDKYIKHSYFSIKDLICDIVGIAAGAGIVLLLI